MKFWKITIILCACLQTTMSQNSLQYILPSTSNDELQFAFVSETMDDRDDPAYQIYREGYNYILDEQWDKARKKMSEIISKFPKSNYIDEAYYWSAYSLKQTDKKKAIDAYTRFIENYSNSKYYDDAVADLAELNQQHTKIFNKLSVTKNARVYVTGNGLYMNNGMQPINIQSDEVTIGEGPDSLIVGKHGITIRSEGKSFKYGYGYTPRVKTLERALELHIKRLNSLSNLKMPSVENKNLNPEIQLKIDALYALGDTKDDEESFRTLKDIALDFKQPKALREAALYTLADFKKINVSPIFIDIAKHDTNEDLQVYAIDYLSQNNDNKEETTSLLIDLFNSIPENQRDQREMIFYSIADIGNNKAIDFLTEVAINKDDYELRRQAVYYLGSIGGEKARAALYKILQKK